MNYSGSRIHSTNSRQAPAEAGGLWADCQPAGHMSSPPEWKASCVRSVGGSGKK